MCDVAERWISQQEGHVPENTKKLDDLFHDTLKDVFYAENKILEALPKMANATNHRALKEAFQKHEKQTQEHVARLKKVFEEIEESPQGKKCDAIEGIVKEGEEIMKDYEGSPALDAGLLASAQAVEHYEISQYGTLKTWAEMLGHEDSIELLEETLEEEKDTDAELTEIARDFMNAEAEDEEEEEE
jgi:ferritin-like metal-binding protein YciE